jgi:hypothetical protein
MKGLYAGGRTIAVLGGAALCLLNATEGPAFAQRGSARPTAAERRVEQMRRQGEQYERDQLSRDLKRGADDPDERRRAQAVAAQIRQDFEGLQAGYNRIVLDMASPEGPHQDLILDAVAKIKKCSSRLKDNLALPQPKEEEDRAVRSEVRPEQMKESLLRLQKYIYSFVTNPLFEAPAVLDVEQAKKASRDLDKIIELSEGIRKSGDRLKKH